MTDVGFYHLTATPFERALPRLLEKVLGAGARAVVLAGSNARIESLDTALWVYDPESFLPHGTAGAGNPANQPVYLTAREENPNGAAILVLIDGIEAEFLSTFERRFDGTDEAAVAAARERWNARKAAGDALTYWKQAPDGRWEKEA